MVLKHKILLLTYNTPSAENIRGASALPYHLLVERDENINVEVLTFNANRIDNTDIERIEQQLHVKIHCMQLPYWYQWMCRLHLLLFRIFFRLPFLCYIRLSKEWENSVKNYNPDMIWIYGEELLGIVKQFSEYKRLHLGPDTESLYYYRMIGQRFVMNNAFDYWKCAIMYRKYTRMEREFPSDENYTYLAVGEEDIRHLQQLNPNVKARFLRHPHYEVKNILNANLNVNPDFNGNVKKFHQPKIKLLIAGRYDLYMKQEADLLVERLCLNANLNPNPNLNGKLLRDYYSITFLGNGWERHVKELLDVGWEVNHITFAPVFIEEICKHDIQITPITIGTGTKGKVLDALANGLLVIGTPYAMENIAVEHGASCIVYKYPQEVIGVLHDIPMNREKYEEMARNGQEAVLKYHDRRLLSKELFSI